MPSAQSNNKAPEPKDIQYYLDILRRRRLLFVILLFAGWFAVWGASWILPPRYKSSTLILVEQPTMPRDYVLPNVAENLQERLQSISQQILSRSRLLRIADQLNLYPKEQIQRSPDEIVEGMRKNINIELVRGNDNRISAFNVSYTAANAAIARQVTSELTSLFINENLEVRQKESEGNTKFLEDQLASARQTLEAQEAQVRQFKGQYIGQLPAQLNSNLQILSGLQTQLQAESEALNVSKQQRIYLETLLNQYRTTKAPAKDGEAPVMGIAELDEQLDRLNAQLRDLTSTYQDQYPEVRRVKDLIAKTQAQRDQLVAQEKTRPSTAASDPGNAVQVSGVRDSAGTAQLQGQLQANQAEIKNREQAMASLTAQINNYQGRLNEEPIREQQLADLTRGYDQSKASYDDLLKKKNDSAMATSMELLQQGERFRVLDPPSLPLNPSFPNRLKFCFIGLFVGVAAGSLAVALVENMDDRVFSESELRKLLPVSVLAELPMIQDPSDDRQQQRKAWLTWATTAVVVAAILAGSAVSYFKG
jgi:polysaccharide chain length determinant protein (PEP-CTERM system associated)